MSNGIIVSVSRLGDGFVVMDASQREHHATDEADLGRVIARLFSDGTLPAFDAKPLTGAMKIRNGAVEIASGVLPASLAPAAAPLVDALSHLALRLRDRSKAPKPRAPSPAGTRRVPARSR